MQEVKGASEVGAVSEMEGKLNASSRWGIKQWGSCDMMGFPYIPLLD